VAVDKAGEDYSHSLPQGHDDDEGYCPELADGIVDE